ncbi:Cyclic nucleotide-binding domain-containing protein [Fontimonas thermophila]|uniref:Cyclic nucleotide-binding domain-containing protein n=1 Tax=Fontimonas thermophila TaxID=1076937 RepID=A0A1I2KDY9_9GAMM|nr:serine/threonine-protein kinase [Fontimonas thermophila]SFF63136.1 Cyclic nucleotide-binding domain-containing protein [Fontimonas thermophila]
MTEQTAVTEPGQSKLPGSIPQRIGKYILRGELGRGACGVVYKGFDPFVQRDVAIKLALQDAAFRDSPAQEHNFFAEARAAGMLQHPHIVALYDAGVENNLSYIVMEFVDGETLVPLCRPKGPRIPLEQVIDIGYKCARALEYAHNKGVLHRDIKPSNVMLTRDGTPKLMDFSIAQILGGEPEQRPDSVLGSPLYMSPEQVRRAPLGPQSDLYSLGAVLFQLLTGTPPFANAPIPELFRAIRHDPAPRVRSLRPDLPEALSEIVARLLLKDPAQRFQSGGELAIALARLGDQLRLAGAQTQRRESRDALRRLHFFNGFSDDEIDEILNASTMATYAAGATIIKEGEVDNACYIIAVGSAEVLKGGKPIHRLERGDCFGEIGFLTAARRTASVVAATQVLALKINATLMEQVSRDCQLHFYKVFTETLIYRLSLTSAKLSALST